MEVDPTNPIAQLCAEGMQAEVEGRGVDALALFHRAWQNRSTDYEAAIAAHYLARHQENVIDALHWNQVALERASASDDQRLTALLPSLYLHLGKTFEELEDLEQADACYFLAQERLRTLEDREGAEVLDQNIRKSMQRVERKLAEAGMRQALAG